MKRRGMTRNTHKAQISTIPSKSLNDYPPGRVESTVPAMRMKHFFC